MPDTSEPSQTVLAMADQLRQYAEHFVQSDWNYTRDTGIHSIRYTDEKVPHERLRNRVRQCLRELTRRRNDDLDRMIEVPRLSMALHYLKRDRNEPDGVLDNGSIITHWEETGEYLQYVQPSVGSLIADWMEAEPDNPHAALVAAEMKRINDAYGQRIKAEGGGE